VNGPIASLNTAWFALIGVLWTGYFVLEGFDFGVGMLSLAIGRDDVDRRLCRNAIGPFWDGNEVWLIVAAGATFAAFPVWYASMFSAFYLGLFLVLAALIVRGVSFEFRGKRDSCRWRAGWDRVLAVGSLLPAFAWGLAFVDLVHGLRLARGGIYLGSFWDLLAPVAVVGGLASLALFVAHGATFLALKTDGPLADRARHAAFWISPLGGALAIGTAAWLAAAGSQGAAGLPGAVPVALAIACGLAFVVSGPLVRFGRPGRAFALSALGIVAATAAVFTALFPRVMVSSGPGPSLTIWSAASANLTLVVMTIVAAIFVPFVLLYQGWSYWVFRQRLTRPPVRSDSASPAGAPGPAAAPNPRG
jgi:cytochrome bd ubiquinol oxidase subunit II